MNLLINIPDNFVPQLMAGANLERQALEALAAEAHRAGRLNHPELRALLGFETHSQLDDFLIAHGFFEDYTIADLEQERRDLDRLGF